MKIVTWNINGIKARIDNLLSWLQASAPERDAVDLVLRIGSTQVRLQGMVGSGDVNAQNRLNATNTLANSSAVGTLNNITSATCTVPTLPAVFPFN